MVGIICPPPVGIGLTDLPNIGGASGPPGPPSSGTTEYTSHSAHPTTNFTNPEFQFPQFKVLQSVFIILCVKSYIGIFDAF